MENKRQKIEIADIFRRFEPDYNKKHYMSHEQQKTFNAIMYCRSQELGGHTLKCNNCGYVQHAYNSCRNRHCPKCQYLKQLMWVDKLKAKLVPVKYFHIIFTIPSAMHKLFYTNQEICYNLLMRSASEAVLKAGENAAFLGAKTGCVAILHTWGQALSYHPHVHLLVPAGGFDSDLTEWVRSEKNFFAPVKVLSAIFRGIFAENVYKHVKDLKSSDNIERIDVAFLRSLIYKTYWNVYAKPALNNAEKVIEYLGRYTHRVAISNARIMGIVNGKVLFRWKDYRQGGKTKIMEVDAVEFISRFMMHVLPCGFYKIRYYGIFSNKLCNNLLDAYLALNDKEMYFSALEGKNWQEIVQDIFGYDPCYCRKCKTGRMIYQININAEPRAA
jgi:hypothetical protein